MAEAANGDFRLLSEDEVKTVTGMLEKNLPDSYHALCFVMNVVDFKQKAPSINTGVYAPNGDFSDSTILVYLNMEEQVAGTYFSMTEAGCQRLAEALARTQLFGDPDYLLFTAVHDRVHRTVGTSWCRLVLDHITPCYLFSISPQDALGLQTSCPEDVTLRPLASEDAPLVDSLWPHRFEGSVRFIGQILKLNPSVGLYRLSDGKLQSWILRWFYGGLGILQTVEEAKRKGYGMMVVAALSKRLAEENWPVHSTVLVENLQSIALFNKMGFTNQFVCHYLEFIKAKPTS